MTRWQRPHLTRPDLNAPGFLSDVYLDLRDRRLLPLIALIVAAIVAVPFLLGGGSDDAAEEELPVASGGAVVKESTQLSVVEEKPGLRDYKKRLESEGSTDPFEQRYTAPVIGDAQLNEPSGDNGNEVPVDSGGEDESPGSSGGDSSGSSPGELTIFTFAAKVRITKSGGKGSESSGKESWVRSRVLPGTPLPGKKAPVVTYMGANVEKERAVLLVSTKVESTFGDVFCETSEDVCQLIEVEVGFPVTFVYGANETRYTVNVKKIEPVVTGRVKGPK